MGGSPLPTYTECRIRGWMGKQRGGLRPGALGLLVPAFPRLRSTRPTVSRVRGGTWPPVREFGMDFWQGQTQVQAWICWGERQVRHMASRCPTRSCWGPPTGDLSSLPTPAGLGDFPLPPSIGGRGDGYSDLRQLSGEPSPVSGAESRGPWLPGSLAGPGWKKTWWVAQGTGCWVPEVPRSRESSDLLIRCHQGHCRWSQLRLWHLIPNGDVSA